MLWQPIQKELDKRKWSLHRFSIESGIPDPTLRMYKYRGSEPLLSTAGIIAHSLGLKIDDIWENKANQKEM